MIKYKFETVEYKKEVTTLELDLPNILKQPAYLHFHYSGGYNYYVKIFPVFAGNYDFDLKEFTYEDIISYFNIWVYTNKQKLIKYTLPINKIKPEFSKGKLIRVTTPEIKIYEEIPYFCLTQSRLEDCFYTVSSEIEFNNQIIQFINNN